MFRQWFGRGNSVKQDQKIQPSEAIEDRTLDCLHLNETGEIDIVPQEALLEALGFRPGKRVCLRCRARFGGPVIAEVDGRHTALARDLARKIRIRNQHAPCIGHE